MKQFLKKHRRLWLSTVTVLSVVVLLGLAVLFPYIMQENGMYLDATPEDLYTLTDKMVETCLALKGKITITFCDDPDRLLANHEARYVYIMAKQIEKKCDNITVETVSLVNNPTAVNRFKPTSATVIEARDVIVSCEERYRILDARSFWTLGENATDDTEYYSFNGEFKLATALLSITSIEEPLVCFAYGHGEKIYVDEDDKEHADDPELLKWNDPNRSEFYHMMRMAGLRVDYINLDKEDVPEDCVLLVMDGPTEDYEICAPDKLGGKDALRRIHAFLAKEQPGSWMLFKDPTETLPNLESLSEDWGIAFENDVYIKDDVKFLSGLQGEDDTRHTLPDEEGSLQKLIVELNRQEDATPYSIYKDLLAVGTTPRMVVEDTGYVRGSWKNGSVGASGVINLDAFYFDFMSSSNGAVDVVIEEPGVGGAYNTAPKDAHAYPLAGLSMRMRMDPVEDTQVFAYYFGAASTSLTENTYLGDSAFSNYDVLFATVRFISRTDEYASMELGGTSLNSPVPGGKPLISVTIPATGYEHYDYETKETKTYPMMTPAVATAWISVLVAVPVIAAAVTGTVLLVKRRNR